MLWYASRVRPGSTLPREFRRLLRAGRSQLITQRVGLQEVPQAIGDSVGSGWIDEERGIARDFRQRREVRGQHRSARRHRLEHRQSKPLVQRGIATMSRRCRAQPVPRPRRKPILRTRSWIPDSRIVSSISSISQPSVRPAPDHVECHFARRQTPAPVPADSCVAPVCHGQYIWFL